MRFLYVRLATSLALAVGLLTAVLGWWTTPDRSESGRRPPSPRARSMTS
jgi:hypothetical protein